MVPQPEDEVTGLLTAVAKYGLPAVLLFWLVWVGSNQVVGDIRAQGVMLQSHVEASQRVVEAINRMESRQDRIEGVLRQTCVNAAHSYTERQSCWNAGAR